MSAPATDILLVEDDRRLAELTAQYFEQNGLTVAVETRGDRALARFTALNPRLVMLDIRLPGTDGLTVCRELRKSFAGPVLIFTANDAKKASHSHVCMLAGKSCVSSVGISVVPDCQNIAMMASSISTEPSSV